MTVNKKVRMVSPENGWAYMICLGLTITFSVCYAPTNSFGIVFTEFLNSNGTSDSIIPYIAGICGFMIAIAGPIVNICTRWFSLRQIALAGSVLYTISWLLHCFIPSPGYMILTYGVMNGIAWGMIQTTSYVVFNSYFVKKRVMMMGICMTVVGIAPIIMPFLIEYWMNTYGFRATIALISVMCANTIVGTALYQPVKWHLVPEIVEEEEVKEKNEKMDVMVPLMDEKKLTINDEEPLKPSLWTRILEKTNLRLFKQLTFCNIAIGIGAGLIGDIYFCFLMPTLLYEYNLPSSEIATCVSIISLTDLASRLFLGILGKYVNIRSFHWYYAGMILTLITRLVFLQFKTYYELAIILSVYGFLRGWIYILFPILIAEEMPNENYTAVYATAIMSNFSFNMFYTIASGIAKSMTETYVTSFYLITFSALFPIVMWSIELFIVRPLKKRNK